MSTATSRIAPRAQRTSLAWPAPSEKCMPRSTPRAEREWLSWTQSSSDAEPSIGVGAERLVEETARVAVDHRLEMILMPARDVSMRARANATAAAPAHG